ncbi:MAG: hypothetical protein RLZZ440_884 [Planctomycetota bacterium]
MIHAGPTDRRDLNTEQLDADLVVVGGGLAGVCCAITAARQGLRVVLIQDRPVLGGNASSEVRLWVLGATSHMGNNNRWAREGGVIDELLVENTWRNPEGNPLIFDTILLEKVVEEPGITLLLNTAIFEVSKADPETIDSVRGFCSQNSTLYDVRARLFCDASGDGVVGFMAGAAFRIGAEGRAEFDEGMAPERPHDQLLGHSIYFYTKDTGRPVRFTPPSFALADITRIPRWRSFNAKDQGCQLWWIEFGGLLDTVHETETIKWELWKVVYGVWDHIKNSGRFPEAENLTLEWVGTVPGKRESRRFEGDAMLSQRDIVEQRRHDDAVSYGGWAIDLHPAEGVYSPESPCTQWHAKGVYQIPFRCLYSRNIRNLFLAGRIISASHVAFGSTRVMATGGHNAQAVGMAAAICRRDGCWPKDLLATGRIRELQRRLLRTGQHIPQIRLDDEDDLAGTAAVTTSSRLRLGGFSPSGGRLRLTEACGMLLPVRAGAVPRLQVWAEADGLTGLTVELRGSSRAGGFTPDELLATREITVHPPVALSGGVAEHGRVAVVAASARQAVVDQSRGEDESEMQEISIDFQASVDRDQYLLVCFPANPQVSLAVSDERVTGVLAVSQKGNRAVSKAAIQAPPAGCGIDTFPFWLPGRRPGGKNLALSIEPPLDVFGPGNLIAGPDRPEDRPNAWVADPEDPAAWAELRWEQPQTIRQIRVSFDTDFDHPMESVLMHHPEPAMPFCIKSARLVDEAGSVIAELVDNHQSHWDVRCEGGLTTRLLRLEVRHPPSGCPAAVFRIRAFA